MPARLAISLQSAAFAWPSDRCGRDTHVQHAVALGNDRVALRTRLQTDREIYLWHGVQYAPDVRTPVFSDPAAPPLTRTRSQSGTKQ